MESVLERVPAGARVAVIRLRSMGDCILTTPALAILKQSRPDLTIGVVVEDRFAALMEGNPDVSTVLPPSIRSLRAFGPRLTLNLHGGPRSLTLTLLSGAGETAGFAHFTASFAYRVRIPTAQEILGVSRKVHTAEHLASAIFYLGVPPREIPRATLFAQQPPETAPYAVFHPMATGTGKNWPATKFLQVARRLAGSPGLRPVFIGGPGEDLSPFDGFQTLAGVSLAELKSLMSGASLFVGNDSGPAHMAAAFGIPVVVIFGNSDPVVWAPWRTSSQTIVAQGPIENVAVEEVLAAVHQLKVAA
jgi:ADP-heptose:LPS heptosyltransferase